MKPRLTDIIHHAADVFGICASDITGRGRQRNILLARHACALLGRDMSCLSYPEIGRRIGGRDHSTVINARRVCLEWIKRCEDYEAKVEEIRHRALTYRWVGGRKVRTDEPERPNFKLIASLCADFFKRKEDEKEQRLLEAMNDDERTSYLIQKYAKQPLGERLAS